MQNSLANIDANISNSLSAAVDNDFQGKYQQTLMLYTPQQCQAERLLLVGTGHAKLCEQRYIRLIESTVKTLNQKRIKSAAIHIDEAAVKGRTAAWKAHQLARLCGEANHRPGHFKSSVTADDHSGSPLKKITLVTNCHSQNRTLLRALNAGKMVAGGVNLARELGDLPGNVCTPSYLARRARQLVRTSDRASCQILNEKQMTALGMGALLSVSKGSAAPAKLIVMEYNGAAKKQAPIVLVGKGVTFDTGGISLKAPNGMAAMKYDMGGAATVFGAIKSAIDLQLSINLVGIVGAVENMPGGSALKPGDVVTSLSSQTVEISNTDAEGRLVLCDCLTYAERFKPRAVIDFATLTAAGVIALGHHANPLYANCDQLANALLNSGQDTGDRAWRLPLWDDYHQPLESSVADMTNHSRNPAAGSIVAACFLARFTGNYHWAHLDISGTFSNTHHTPNATGRPVPLVVEYLCKESGASVL